MTKNKDDRPFAELKFYRERVVARVREISLSYDVAVVLTTILVVFLSGFRFDQIIVLIRTLADVLR